MKDIKLNLGDGTSQDQTPKTIFQSEKHIDNLIVFINKLQIQNQNLSMTGLRVTNDQMSYSIGKIKQAPNKID